MEEYTQITLDEWMQWKEDIRRKLAETADNFVYIGYRLKQIRDSGMYGGAADVFEFAQNEYGLGKSTVSRFIAINEKYSEGGNSLELKEEFRGFSSSKLSEMLTLPDNECQLITERTTVKEIRELKNFDRQQISEKYIVKAEAQPSPLQKCLVDYFKDKKEMLNAVIKAIYDKAEKEAVELMNPSGYGTHKKGICFMFMYDYNTGVKAKMLTEPEPVIMTWKDVLEEIFDVFGYLYEDGEDDIHKAYYGELEKENEKAAESEHQRTEETQKNQGKEDSVATSQQNEIDTEVSHDTEGMRSTQNTDNDPQAAGVINTCDETPGIDQNEPEPTDNASGTGDGAGSADVENDSDVGSEPPAAEQLNEQINISAFPEYMPDAAKNARIEQAEKMRQTLMAALKDILDTIYLLAENGKIADAEERLEAVRGTLHKIAELAEKV